MPSPNRPLSPHLGIYRWQNSNTLSILHRITGFGLALGLIPLAFWLWGAAYHEALFNWLQMAFASPVGLFCLAGWTVAFYYHLANGLRHLNWDIGRGLSLPEMAASGRLTLLFTFTMSAFTWLMVARKLGWL